MSVAKKECIELAQLEMDWVHQHRGVSKMKVVDVTFPDRLSATIHCETLDGRWIVVRCNGLLAVQLASKNR